MSLTIHPDRSLSGPDWKITRGQHIRAIMDVRNLMVAEPAFLAAGHFVHLGATAEILAKRMGHDRAWVIEKTALGNDEWAYLVAVTVHAIYHHEKIRNSMVEIMVEAMRSRVEVNDLEGAS